jgi:hypothetical protein
MKPAIDHLHQSANKHAPAIVQKERGMVASNAIALEVFTQGIHCPLPDRECATHFCRWLGEASIALDLCAPIKPIQDLNSDLATTQSDDLNGLEPRVDKNKEDCLVS